ncbi:serine/threonine-protein kinase [Actinoplanes sp. NPDC020271]|uniref:serine/threonine-protein kinase n=1 Tax=Actinoplanes sp. NPDC020271 TaxID=3363896 RepID=UPI00378E134D
MSERGGALRPEDPVHIGAYELVGRLGAGGMGVVYEARGIDGQSVAVKVVHAEYAADGEFRARFRSEVARARQVPPFCTAAVLDADPEAARPYLVVEFVDGPSLAAEVARRGPLSAPNLHGLAIGVATALAAIHEAGVIHRDLKPQNVLLAPGSPKVIDFGIARALESATQHTRTGEVVGTVNYMAPERFGDPDVPVTPAADIFAWGCVVAYASQGRPPFDAESAVGVFGRIMNGNPTLDGLTGALRVLVQRALSPVPEQRPTARELVEALLDRTQVHPELRAAVDGIIKVRKRRRGVRTLVVVLALALAGGLGFALRPRNDDDVPKDDVTRLVMPSGTLELSDPLVVEGKWEQTSVEGDKTYCRYVDDRLQVQNHSTGVWQCQGERVDLKGSFAVEVSARIERAGSCLGVWFAESRERVYRLDVCANAWRVQAESQGNGDTLPVHEWASPVAVPGTELRLQVAVQDGVLRVGHDGILIGEQTMPETDVTGGAFGLGVISDQSDARVSFSDVEAWSV